ncbi:RloB family protein [Kiloniella sp.]|uniref:RloB family protein n=1 Tax=Kiloniella sp. TaxID=1938587 RepID=UPI003B02D3AF
MGRDRRNFSRISGTRDPSLIVLATEGTETEPQYFEGVKEKCVERSSRIHIEILKRDSQSSSPKHVLEELKKHHSKMGLNSRDELCLVIDRDKQSWDEAQISEVATLCGQKQYLLALSNPCFEVWLLLHLKCPTEYSEEKLAELFANQKRPKEQHSPLKKEIRSILGSFNPSNLNIDDFWHGVEEAIERAKRLDIAPRDRWQNTIGTRVYVFMEKILNSIRD